MNIWKLSGPNLYNPVHENVVVHERVCFFLRENICDVSEDDEENREDCSSDDREHLRRQDYICVLRLKQKAPSQESLINAHHSKKEKNCVGLVAVLVQLCQTHLKCHSEGDHYPEHQKGSTIGDASLYQSCWFFNIVQNALPLPPSF